MNLPDTLTQALDARAGMRRHIHYIAGEEQKSQMSFAALKATALGVLRHFQDFGMQAGDELIIFTSSNEQFIDSFWACLYGGIVPVPVAVGISDDHRLKLLKIFRQLRHPWVYTEKAQLGRLREYAAEAGLLAEFEALNARALPVENLRELAGAGTPRLAKPGDVAFIQFSSGSTSDPKGVVLTHANVMANLRGITRCAAFTDADVSLSWMPLTHDMGLIGFHLCMLASGIEHTIMDTRLFSRRPLLWLQEAALRGATLLSSPNFGYKHFLKVFESRGLDAIDLSRVRLIFNGAEPISVPLCERFLQAMAPFGLRREAMYPVYGLAEASLAVTFPPPGRAYRTVTVDRRSLGAGQAVRSIDAGQRDALELMRLGSAVDHCAIRIVDDSGAVVAGGHVGHIEIRGDNVTGGYHGGVNAEAFTTDGWLRTGDLGFEVEGELVVTGRHKELIFANGENCYPHDIESIAADGTGVELGKLAVAGARRPGADEDELLVFLLHRSALADFIPLANRVRQSRAPAHHRADRAAGGASAAGEEHPQDHQRQGPARPAGACLRGGPVRRRYAGTRRHAARAPRPLGGDRIRHRAAAAAHFCQRGHRPPGRRRRRLLRDRHQLHRARPDLRAHRRGIPRPARHRGPVRQNLHPRHRRLPRGTPDAGKIRKRGQFTHLPDQLLN